MASSSSVKTEPGMWMPAVLAVSGSITEPAAKKSWLILLLVF